jgi:isoleucyl-tRNA synthetase
MMSSPLMAGGDLAMSKDGSDIAKAMRQVILRVWNAYSFFTLYANIDEVQARMHAHRSNAGARPLHFMQDPRTHYRAGRKSRRV